MNAICVYMFFRLYCHPTVYGRQRNGLKDCRTLHNSSCALYALLFVHKCLSQRIETTVCPCGDGDLEVMYDRPYGTQYNILRLITGMIDSSKSVRAWTLFHANTIVLYCTYILLYRCFIVRFTLEKLDGMN